MNADSAENLGADGSILSYNLFAYCGNNPILFVDVFGLEAKLDEYVNKNYAGQKNIAIVVKRPVPNSREAATIENGKLNNGHSFIRIDALLISTPRSFITLLSIKSIVISPSFSNKLLVIDNWWL